MFAGKRHFREFLQSEEAISSNVLADRLGSLVESGIVTKSGDPTHAQKAVYSLTEKGLELLPVLVAMSAWTQKHFPQDAPARGGATRAGRSQVREATRGTPSAGTRHLVMTAPGTSANFSARYARGEGRASSAWRKYCGASRRSNMP